MSVAALHRQQASSALDQPYEATARLTASQSTAKPTSASLIASDIKHGDWRDALFRDGPSSSFSRIGRRGVELGQLFLAAAAAAARSCIPPEHRPRLKLPLTPIFSFLP